MPFPCCTINPCHIAGIGGLSSDLFVGLIVCLHALKLTNGLTPLLKSLTPGGSLISASMVFIWGETGTWAALPAADAGELNTSNSDSEISVPGQIGLSGLWDHTLRADACLHQSCWWAALGACSKAAKAGRVNCPVTNLEDACAPECSSPASTHRRRRRLAEFHRALNWTLPIDYYSYTS